MKQSDIPFKERQRRCDYQDKQTERQDKLAERKEIKRLVKLKEQALKALEGGEQK